jgi:hypothetical protein
MSCCGRSRRLGAGGLVLLVWNLLAIHPRQHHIDRGHASQICGAIRDLLLGPAVLRLHVDTHGNSAFGNSAFQHLSAGLTVDPPA